MNVPGREVLQRAGVHHDQRWVDDGAGVHQGTGQGIFAALHAGEDLANHIQGVIGIARRVHASRQAGGAGGDVDDGIAMLAGQPGQGAGFGPADIGLVAGAAHDLAHDEGAKGAWGQKYDLAVCQVRSHDAGNIGLGNGGRRNQYQIGTGDGLANIGADFGNGDFALACFVFQGHDWTVQQGLQLGRITTP